MGSVNDQNNTHIIPSYNDLCALLHLENTPDLIRKKKAAEAVLGFGKPVLYKNFT